MKFESWYGCTPYKLDWREYLVIMALNLILLETSKLENIKFCFRNLGAFEINVCMFPNQWHHKIQRTKPQKNYLNPKLLLEHFYDLCIFSYQRFRHIPLSKALSHFCLRRNHGKLFNFNLYDTPYDTPAAVTTNQNCNVPKFYLS